MIGKSYETLTIFNETPLETLLIVIVIGIVLFFLLIKGVVKTFKRQPIVAIICIIFIFPIYLFWAFVELFTAPIREEVASSPPRR